MAYNYTLEYRTFDEILVDVASDFKKYQLKDLIDSQDMIKVVKRVNYDLGMRIHKTKEIVLEVEKGKVRMPNDFYVLNFALVVGKYQTKEYYPQGTHVEERIVGQVVPEYNPPPPDIDLCDIPAEPAECDPCDPCCPQCGETTVGDLCTSCCGNPDSCTISCKGEVINLVQTMTSETRYYTEIYPLRITSNTEDLNGLCPNLYWDAERTAVLRNGWLYTSFETGKVYLNYEGNLEDDEGNLLAPNHPFLNEYYEYAIKQRILENLILNDEEINPNKLQLIEQRYRAARNNALSVVNTPNFQELKELFKANRNAQYSKYYDMFANHSRLKFRSMNSGINSSRYGR